MPCLRLGPGNELHQNKAGGLTLNLFLQFCALFQVNIILKIFKMNFCQSDIPGALLGRCLVLIGLVYSRMALCIP